MLTVNFGSSPTTADTFNYWTNTYQLSTYGYYVSGMPPMYDSLPDYTAIAVVNLKTGVLLGQFNDSADSSFVDQVLAWVDQANQ